MIHLKDLFSLRQSKASEVKGENNNFNIVLAVDGVVPEIVNNEERKRSLKKCTTY